MEQALETEEVKKGGRKTAPGVTYNPLQLVEDDYEKLARIYPDITEVYPWHEAKNVRNRMNMDLAPFLATEIRYLARKNAVGQGYIVRRMMEALRNNGIVLDLRVR